MSFANCRLVLLYMDRELLRGFLFLLQERNDREGETILDEDA